MNTLVENRIEQFFDLLGLAHQSQVDPACIPATSCANGCVISTDMLRPYLGTGWVRDPRLMNAE